MSNVRLSSLLGLVLPRCEPSWMPAESAARIVAAARQLPDVATSVGFEVRLTGSNHQVDLGVAVVRSAELWDAWERFDFAAAGADAAASWGAVGVFLHDWSKHDGTLATWIPYIYWEVDQTDGAVVPNVFVTFDWPLSVTSASEERRRAWDVARHALTALLDDGDFERSAESVARAFSRMPDGGRVVHAGVMFGRTDDGVRISAAVPHPQCARYLTDLGLDGPWYAEELARMCPANSRTHFEIDMMPSAARPRVGVVVSSANGSPDPIAFAHADPRIDGVRVAGIERWLERGAVTSSGLPFGARLGLSHLKIDLAPDVPPAVKAYLIATATG